MNRIPIVAMVNGGAFHGLPITADDVRMGEQLDLDPSSCAIARLPLSDPMQGRGLAFRALAGDPLLPWGFVEDRRLCPDGGGCGHGCTADCWRVQACGPVSGVYPGGDWPAIIVAEHRGQS